MHKTQRVLAGCVYALATLVTTALPSFSQERERSGGATANVRGAVKSVDAKAGTITITFGGGREGGGRDGGAPREIPATEKTFPLAKNVEICVGGMGGGIRGGGAVGLREAKLADLLPGVMVHLALTADHKAVDAVIAEEPVVRGFVKGVDVKKSTLTVSLGAAGGGGARERGGEAVANEEATYTIAADAEIGIDDGRGRRFSVREGKIEELAEGSIVTVRLSLDKKTAHGVLAEGALVHGVVKAIDPAKRSLTLTMRAPRGDDAGEERLLAVAKEAVIIVDDGKGRRLSVKEGKLADVPVGATVVIKMAVDQSFIMLLKAEGPTLTGMLKAIDADKRAITIAFPRGRGEAEEEKTLTVAKDAHINIDGKDAKLADLKVGDSGPMLQLRLTLDQQRVQAVFARQPGAR